MARQATLSPVPRDVEASPPTSKLNGGGKKRKAETPATASKRARKSAPIADELGSTEAPKRKPRTKKDVNVAPLEERTFGSSLLVGAHVSSAGGVHNSITNLIHIGYVDTNLTISPLTSRRANAFALFLKSQRTWKNPDLNPEHAKLFIDSCKKQGIQPGTCCVPHGSYLVNLAHPDETRKKQAYDSFLDDLKRCHKLGIKLYNFHPGNSNASTREDGIKLIAEHINTAHKDPETGHVMPLLETMATVGNTIGGSFEDIAEIISHVEDKDRVGVCLDTCHVFAAGYDLRSPEAYNETMTKFDKIIGLKYLKALHVNDSKADFGTHRDLHAQLGTGCLGLRAFHNIANDERLHGLPMVLETPIDVVGEDGKKTEDRGIWAREIKMLEKLVGMDMDSDEFKELEAKLHKIGAGERERIGKQTDNSKAKKAKAQTPKKVKQDTQDEQRQESG
ncbi:AP endonuclease [Polyplosphaeria fusca]|uniref:Apurinic-apyrimidinic endonuclease 1 n=1 Tax=Polyplosphaeria fusca TaxID=682080 RepID=A0A9P4QLQ9_9PLEO|nr:AP endonuclease [Polyplosphaeria fusca]